MGTNKVMCYIAYDHQKFKKIQVIEVVFLHFGYALLHRIYRNKYIVTVWIDELCPGIFTYR